MVSKSTSITSSERGNREHTCDDKMIKTWPFNKHELSIFGWNDWPTISQNPKLLLFSNNPRFNTKNNINTAIRDEELIDYKEMYSKTGQDPMNVNTANELELLSNNNKTKRLWYKTHSWFGDITI